MGLLSLFKRNDEAPAESPATPDAVAQARAQARRRLIGAAVLLAIGVIVFPLLFETRPRPVRMDIPIEIPRKEGAAPLVMPPAAVPAAAIVPPADAPAETTVNTARPGKAASAAASASAVITERAGEQGREVAPLVAKAGPTAAAPAPKPAAAASPAGAMAVTAPPPAAAVDEGARARAILEGQPLPPAASVSASGSGTRIVVQVGAYTEDDKLNEVRQKVEKLGLKTYTQVVETDGARRTRVRVGPFPSRSEADKAAARLKAAGLPVAVLTL